MSETVATLEIDGRIARLVVDGPPRNEMGRPFFDGLLRMAREVLPTLDVDGMLVHGRGRHFSSGADIPGLRRLLSETSDTSGPGILGGNAEAFSAIEGCRFPVVAAISGCCIGSGLELALACHARVASRSALLALPEVEHGLMPGCGGTVRLSALAGFRRAMTITLTGMALTAGEALDAGVVDVVVDRSRLIAAAEAMVRALGPTGGWREP